MADAYWLESHRNFRDTACSQRGPLALCSLFSGACSPDRRKPSCLQHLPCASFDRYGPTWPFRIQPGPLFLSCLNFAAPKPLRSYSRPNNPYSIAMTWSDFRCRLPICRIYRHPISNVSIRVIAPAQAGTNSRRPDGAAVSKRELNTSV